MAYAWPSCAALGSVPSTRTATCAFSPRASERANPGGTTTAICARLRWNASSTPARSAIEPFTAKKSDDRYVCEVGAARGGPVLVEHHGRDVLHVEADRVGEQQQLHDRAR